MKKQYIWLLIGLMAIALLGIIGIQSYLIRQNIRVNEAKFDKEVHASLNHVEKTLVADYQNQDMHLLTPEPGARISGISKLDQYFARDSFLEITQDYPGTTFRSTVTDRLTLLEPMPVGLLDQPLEERISIARLDKYLAHHLNRRGIAIDYDYGVYSNQHKGFVIQNGSYNVIEEGDQFTSILDRSLLSSEYSIDLFLNADGEAALGKLHLTFPGRRSILFQDVLPSILWMILFTALILFCFTYTIQVIFRQKKLSEMTTDFINNMTHEFKTPIATINLASDSITSPMVVNDASKVGRFANIIKQENKRMLGQVEKVLQMALLEKRDFKLRKSTVNLNDIITQAVDHVNLEVQKRGGLVTAELGAASPILQMDQTHITNIIRNLLDNANKYSQDAPEIKVSTRDVGKDIEIKVSDKGIGMTRDQLKHIFDKFYRVHTGNRHDVKGFGLGLSYVKAMVDAHGGKINVSSELGRGSIFTMTFPRDNAHEN